MGQSRILHRTGYSLLYRRQGIYRFRRFVPKDLREIIGQREIKISLRTTDLETAKRRLALEVIKSDPSIFSPPLQIRDEISGRTIVLDQGGLPLGLDTSFVPGKFYKAADFGFYWFCKAIKGEDAVMILVESFQHGQLLQATATMSVGRAKFFVEVGDAQVVARLERRLRRYNA